MTFRGAPVALLLLGRKTAPSQRDLVSPNDLAPGQQLKHMVLFQNQDRVSLLCPCGLCSCECVDRREGKGEYEKEQDAAVGVDPVRFHWLDSL